MDGNSNKMTIIKKKKTIRFWIPMLEQFKVFRKK